MWRILLPACMTAAAWCVSGAAAAEPPPFFRDITLEPIDRLPVIELAR
jgi:hypothetical protein